MPETNIAEQIKLLVELQELDKEIYRLNDIVESAPEEVKRMESDLESKKSAMQSAEEEVKKLQTQHKEKEVDLGTKEASIKKYQGQLYQVKTNKEYASLEKEIAGIKADNSILEDEILKSFDNIETGQKKLAEEKKKFEEEKIKTDSEKIKIEQGKKAAQAEIEKFISQRKTFTEKVDKGILEKYERVLKNRSGNAVVPVVNEASCGGCNMNLPPQVVNEAKLKKDIVLCGNCARILYCE